MGKKKDLGVRKVEEEGKKKRKKEREVGKSYLAMSENIIKY